MNNIISNVWYLYKWLAFKRRIQFFLIVMFSIFVSVMEMIAIGSVVPFVSSLMESKSVFSEKLINIFKSIFEIKDKESLIILLALFFVIFAIITGLCRSILIYIISRYSNVVTAEIGTSLYNQKLNEPFIKFISKSSEDIITLISAKLPQIYSVITGILLLVTSVILLFSIVGILLFIDFKLTLVSLTVFGIMYFFVVLSFRNSLLKNSKIISQNSTLMVKSLQEGVGSIRDIILDGNQKIHLKLFSQLIFEKGYKVAINDVIIQSPRFLLETIGIILISVYLFLFSNIENGVLNLFPVLSALALGAQRIMPLMNIIYTQFTSTVSNSHQLNEAVLNLKQGIKNKSEIKIAKNLSFKENILIKNVYFKYSKNLPDILQNLNFEVKKGSKIGIVGKTGVGKSTLLDIIMGLLNPTSGQLFIDDKLLTEENIEMWRRQVTHVPQDIFLINGSILENIALGIETDSIDKIKVEECARKSEILNFIQTLPHKFNEKVGERGIKLSGGQKQRIGIARALYRKSELIVMDEATNALDLKTERKIIDSIGEFKNTTIIMVTHRLDTLKICDKVYQVDKNSIKETLI